ncbi:MAG: hypothetical protein ABW277_26175 [Longimicrobiaceae bacterium]
MRKIRLLLVLAGVGIATATLSSPTPGYADGKCDGRESWLVPGVCTYCQWGGACGACQLSPCNATEEEPTVE